MMRSAQTVRQSATTMSLAGFAIAIAGAFISFLPLLQILLPMKVAEVAPTTATATLSTVAAAGAAIAGIANLGIGWLSDRTPIRLGRRKPWIVAGLLGMLPSYALLWAAHSAVALLAAFALFQLFFNMMFAPLLALVADRVPPAKRGRVSGIIALGVPIGTFVGTVVIGPLFAGSGERFAVLAMLVLVCIGPFALTLGADPPALRQPSALASSMPQSLDDGRLRNFVLGCVARVCVLCAFTIAQLYILFYAMTVLPGGNPLALPTSVALLGAVYGITSSLSGIMMGYVSDRIGRRKPLVIGMAVLVGFGMAMLAIASSWPIAVAGYALFALGAGGHTSVEFAMMVGILPSQERAARDLGIVNFTNIVPQIVAPLGVVWIISLPGATIHWGFAAGALAAMIGAALVSLMRSVP